MKKAYFGIDNGLHGCISVILFEKQMRIEQYDMPIVTNMTNKKKRNQFDEKEVFNIFLNYTKYESHAFIENVTYMPGQSSQSSGSIGYGYGLMVMALTACRISFETVTVRKWQKEFGIYGKGKETKNQAYRVASKLFPKLELKTKRGRLLDGRSDSILLAEFCRRTTGGN